MDKQTIIEKARGLETRYDLLKLLNEMKADLLGRAGYPFTMKKLLILCNPNHNLYTQFSIPKKSGGERSISVPFGNLKYLQLCLNEIFKALYTASPYTMGFVEGRSVVDNARMHTNQNYVFNVDLKDFFPSIDQARVWKRLQLPPFCFNATVASVIAGLCSKKTLIEELSAKLRYRFVLPQGAPTSPLLANAVCDTLDRRLHGLAKRFGLHYSRYADDITFSSMHNVYQPDSDFRKELKRIIADQGFSINNHKVRLQHCSGRQVVTGITVGRKLNVGRKYVKDLRAILHIWEKYGIDAAYAAFYPRYMSEKCRLNRGELNLRNVIAGKLCYLKMVKGEKDPVYSRLNAQFRRLTENCVPAAPNASIDYLFTMPLAAFEKKLDVKLRFCNREIDNKPYAMFDFQGRRFIVAVSRNLDVRLLPRNVQISLTRMATPMKGSPENGEKISGDQTRDISVVYLLHKPYSGKIQYEDGGVPGNPPLPDLREFVVGLAEKFPELELRDDLGIIREDY